ncbi:MAG TPA: hypothetical protein VHD61_05375 [Lacunisphaera sp.]|nr:hypothetical protein [Lacunisphaera sp.]
MKLLRHLVAALAAVSLLSITAFAADINGNWKWTSQGRTGNTIETTARFQFKDGALTGTVSGRMGEVAIGDASFKDDHVAFTVTREFNGEKFVIKYDGKLAGDTITGTVVRPGRDGDMPVTLEWKATRAN